MTNRLRGRGQGPQGRTGASTAAAQAAAAASAASADLAQQGAATATTKAGEASDDAAAADLAANAAAAFLNGKLYADVAEAEAAAAASPPTLAEGDYFFTVDPAGQLYQISSGSAQEQDFVLASTTAQQAIVAALAAMVLTRLGAGLAVRDSSKNLLIEITPTRINHYAFNLVKALAEQAEVAGLAISKTIGDGLVIRDALKNILIDIQPRSINHYEINDFRERILALESHGGSTSTGASLTRDSQWDSIQINAQRVLIAIYGQSLSRGNLSTPAISINTNAYSEMFVGGVRPDDLSGDTGAVDAGDFASIVPLVESTKSNLGETPTAACLKMIAQLLADEDGVDINDMGQTFLGCAPGLNGQTVLELSDGTVPYARLEEAVTQGYAISDAEDASFVMGVMGWLQGEADYSDGTSGSTYKTRLATLVASIRAHQASVIGYDRPVPVVMYQVATHPHYSVTEPNIAIAQLELCNDPDTYYCMAAPCYPVSFAGDGLHLTNTGSAHIGAYIGLAIKRWLVDGVKILPFRPTVQRAGKSLLLQFPVEAGKKLVLHDWAGLSDYGLELYDSGDTPIAITSIDLLRDGYGGVCVVNTDTTLATGTKLNFGWVGDSDRGLTGFRDNSGDTMIFDPDGLALALHRWCPIDQIVTD